MRKLWYLIVQDSITSGSQRILGSLDLWVSPYKQLLLPKHSILAIKADIDYYSMTVSLWSQSGVVILFDFQAALGWTLRNRK